MLKWEMIADDTFRLSVPGGWVIATANKMNQSYVVSSTVFIPDERHQWSVGPLTPDGGEHQLLQKLQQLKVHDAEDVPTGPYVHMNDVMAAFGFVRQD